MKKSKVYWACRRGMLELDSMLIPFCQECFESLTDNEKNHFWQLLKEPDQTLQDWLMSKKEPNNTDFIDMINKIKQYTKIIYPN